jgi:hypothetical protein
MSETRRNGNAWDATDTPNGTSFDLPVPGNRRLGRVAGIDPDVVAPSGMVQETSVGAKMTFELAMIHGFVLWIGCSHRKSAKQFGSGTTERLEGIAGVDKSLPESLGLGDEFRIQRRSDDEPPLLSRFESQDQFPIGDSIGLFHTRALSFKGELFKSIAVCYRPYNRRAQAGCAQGNRGSPTQSTHRWPTWTGQSTIEGRRRR